MPKQPRAEIQPTVDADLFVAYEDLRRGYARGAEEFADCTTLRDWIILWLRAGARLSQCVAWGMSSDTLLSQKMRAELPDALMSLATVLVAWRVWWHRQ